jgi:UDP-GlcNAc:undecaprenyl-phosphate/decaprenyl-phosphate GlcNAc-1-phosphate transferase
MACIDSNAVSLREATTMFDYSPHHVQGFLITVLAIELLRTKAHLYKLIDRPSLRKRHIGEVPVVGGLGIFIGLVLSFCVMKDVLDAYLFLLPGVTILVVVGAVDDMRDLSPSVKLLFQIIAAGMTILIGGYSVNQVGELLPSGILETGYLAPLITVVAVVGMINATNMLDGIDGLAGGVCAVALFWITILGGIKSPSELHVIAIQVMVGVLAFLLFNARMPWRRRASVFLGDAGSMMLGFLVAWFAIELSQREHSAWSPVTMLWILALPVIDMASVVARRTMAGRNPLSADRQHLHHLLQDTGMSAGRSALLLVGSAGIIGGLGVALDIAGFKDLMLLLLFGIIGVLHSIFVAILKHWIRLTQTPEPSRRLGRPGIAG